MSIGVGSDLHPVARVDARHFHGDRRILGVVPMDWTWHMIFFTIFVPCVFDVLLWVYGTYLPTIIVVSAYIIFLSK